MFARMVSGEGMAANFDSQSSSMRADSAENPGRVLVERGVVIGRNAIAATEEAARKPIRRMRGSSERWGRGGICGPETGIRHDAETPGASPLTSPLPHSR